jgi:hypothetical protein
LELATFVLELATLPLDLAKSAIDFAEFSTDFAEFSMDFAELSIDFADSAIDLAEFAPLSSVDLPQEVIIKLETNKTKNIKINFRFIKTPLKFSNLKSISLQH